MAGLNAVSFTGRLGRDPELRTVGDGKTVCNFSLAVDRFGRDADPLWLDVSVWGRTAENVSRYVAKGSKVAISGRLDPARTFDRRDGSTGVSLNVTANDVVFLDSRSDQPAQTPRPGSDIPVDTSDYASAPAGDAAGQDTDIPF